MAKNSFDKMKVDAWLLPSLFYSYITLLISFAYLAKLPIFSLVIELVTVLIILYSMKKDADKKYRVAFMICLFLHLLLTGLVCWFLFF